jgi:hypothetical protein
MRRRQLVELEDLAWCPSVVRDGGTDWLAFMMSTARVFSAVAPRIRAAMNATGTHKVIDLCSGGGGPWLTLERELARTGRADITLSDLYPNIDALRDVCDRSGGRLSFYPRELDATNVPAEIPGVRTMFNSFHHFPPSVAAAILTDAVRSQRAIAVFEGINHRGVGLLAIPAQLPALLLLTPFVRPFRWSRMLFTYILPLIPFLVLFDGTVSVLRLYSEDEMRKLVLRVPGHERFAWEIGSTSVLGTPVGVSYLVGVPK